MSSPQPLAPQQASGNLATLPDRAVTAATLEDAYVRFIFYCNPALPLGCDTASLREAFRNPPRSGGKVFSTFAIFDLVKRFYAKEIRTWSELTTRLGVEPPDPTKDESAQKIAQYGVRLKKWMNSMHVKAFFEYLMVISNDYWTNIPSDPSPIAQPVRDGVAVEDDMVLRALLPHIRPKRGRKRPDGNENAAASSTQRQRLSPASAIDNLPVSWSDPSRLGTAVWGLNDSVQIPLSRWPNSAITPTTRGPFWDDALEPRSAVTPSSKQKLSSHRRGAKNVSSAWKPGGPDSGTKTRGRPPMHRTPVEAPNPAVMAWAPIPDSNPAEPSLPKETIPMINTDPSQMNPPSQQVGSISLPTLLPPAVAAAASSTATAGMSEGSRPARPSISLQVPERQGGPVRLATPPPMLMINNQQEGNNDGSQGGSQEPLQTNGWYPFSQPAATYDANGSAAPGGADGQGSSSWRDVPQYYFENIEDRTNVDGLISYFMHTLHTADWVDPEGNQQEPAGMEECAAMVNATVEQMYKSAESSQAFLINLAALCGAKMLMMNNPRCYRVETSRGVYAYNFDWQYRFSHLEGQFTMTHSVPVRMWKKPAPGEASEGAAAEASQPLSEEQWQAKYKALMEEMERRDQELFDLQNKVMTSLKGTGRNP